MINELIIEPKNYPLLLFAASKKKFRQFLEQIVKEDNSIYIYYAYRIKPELTKEVLEMSGKSRSYRRNLEFIAKDIGRELIPFLSTEDRIRGLDPEDLVRILTPQERKKLKQLLNEKYE